VELERFFGPLPIRADSVLIQAISRVKKKRDFDPHAFLATIGEGRKIVSFPTRQTIFTQGDAADAIFYIQRISFSIPAKRD
jgi:CRP-like cAMP-binding protein